MDDLFTNQQNLGQGASASGFLGMWETYFWIKVTGGKPQGKIALGTEKHSNSYWAIYLYSGTRARTMCVNGLQRVHWVTMDGYWTQLPLKEMTGENAKPIFVLPRNPNLQPSVIPHPLFHRHLHVIATFTEWPSLCTRHAATCRTVSNFCNGPVRKPIL